MKFRRFAPVAPPATPTPNTIDTFNRGPYQTWGPDWFPITTTGSLVSGQQEWQGWSILLNKGRIGYPLPPAANNSYATGFFPNAQIATDVDGAAQYAEITLSSDTSAPGTLNNYGPMVFAAATMPVFSIDIIGYFILINPTLPTWALVKNTDITSSIPISGALASWGPGDKLTLKCTPTGATNVLDVLLNDVSIGTTVDATPITNGYPGVYVRLVDLTGAAITSLSRFAGGLI